MHSDSQAIDTLGGATAVAALFDIRPQAVSQWRRDGIPRARRMYLALRFPQLFGEPGTAQVAEEARDAA